MKRYPMPLARGDRQNNFTVLRVVYIDKPYYYPYNINWKCYYTGRTVAIEALIALIALCGVAGYMLGKDINKAKK